MDVRRLPARSRGNSVLLLLGVVIGLLVAGLAVPFAFGERLTTTSAAPASDGVVLDDLSAVADGTATDVGAALPGAPAPGAGAAAGGADPAGAVASGGGSAAVGSAPSGGGPAGGAPQPQAGSADAPAGGPAARAPAGPGGQAPLRATDRGVTAKTIKVGFTAIDTGGLSRVGVGIGVTVEAQEAGWRAFVKDINARGGINGRQIVPAFASFDPLSENSQREACLRLTQDEKVFAVVGGFNFPVAISCVTRQNATPLFSGYPGTQDELFEQSGGMLVTMYPRASRMMAITAAALDAAGKLKGRTIGILNSFANDPGGKTGAQLEQILKSRGHTVKRRVELSADSGAASSQVPLAVNQFQREGIDTVFLLSGVVGATQFVQQADNQGYRPSYHMTDWSSNNNDFTVQNMPQSFEGSIGTTHTAGNGNKMLPGGENAGSARCRQVFDEHSGRKLAPRGSAEYGATTQNCDTMQAFERAARAAGPELTRRSVVGAVPSLGTFQIGNWGPGRFGPGKLDFSEQVRFHVFSFGCKCWKPSGGFFSPR